MEITPVLENREMSVPHDQVLTFLQSNRQIFQASPELLQRVLRFLQTFLPAGKPEKKKIILPQTNGFMLIEEKEIHYLKAEGSYTQLTLYNGEKVLISRPLKDFRAVLSDAWFERIHKSYIINLRYLKGFSRLQGGTAIMEDGTELLISRRRLTIFLEKMAKIALSLE
ncbi:MAG: LytTR family DNA-binding domain-containing protein [Bacteroidia bacterium]|nr:LytTR family DNA-binding domain-containing protein [Bacteroidia bacterium]